MIAQGRSSSGGDVEVHIFTRQYDLICWQCSQRRGAGCDADDLKQLQSVDPIRHAERGAENTEIIRVCKRRVHAQLDDGGRIGDADRFETVRAFGKNGDVADHFHIEHGLTDRMTANQYRCGRVRDVEE